MARKGSAKRSCVAAWCINFRGCRIDKPYSFFSFPKQEERFRQWLQFSLREDLLGKSPEQGKHWKLCSAHFHQSQFLKTYPKPILMRNAVPTITLEQEESFSMTTCVATSGWDGHTVVDVNIPGPSTVHTGDNIEDRQAAWAPNERTPQQKKRSLSRGQPTPQTTANLKTAEAGLSVYWKGHSSEVATEYKSLLENNIFVDCTISAEGQSLKAHRLVLSACSSYFHLLFREETGEDPFIILVDVSFETLKTVIDYVYQGEVYIPEGNLQAFLTLAQSLQIKGINAFVEEYKNKNLSNNSTENVHQCSSENNDDSCEGESISATHETRAKSYSQLHPNDLVDCSDAVHSNSSVPCEDCRAIQSASMKTPSLNHQRSQSYDEVTVKTEINVNLEHSYSILSGETRNQELNNFKSEEHMTGSLMNEVDGTVSLCDKQYFNRMPSAVDHPSEQDQATCNGDGQRRRLHEGEPSSASGQHVHVGRHSAKRALRCANTLGQKHVRTHTGVRLHICDVCGKAFKGNRKLTNHMRTHTGERPFICDVCGKAFVRKHHLANHKRLHTGERPFLCDVCGKAFNQKHTLIFHMSAHTEEFPYICDVCGKAFSEENIFTSHMGTHTEERPSICDVCGKALKSKISLEYHKRTHTEVRRYICDVCGKTLRWKKTLLYHKRTHTGERPYICVVCGKSYCEKTNLTTHMFTHSGERPHICDVCGKAFSMKAPLIRHMRTHTGERPFICDVCGKAFSSDSSFALHKRIHSGVRPYICDVCSKAFTRKDHLDIHMRSHTGERPYLCEVCGKAFSEKPSLTTHMRTHITERPYTCDMCGKAFRSEGSLIVHKRLHTKKRPYICDVCSVRFSRKDKFIIHMRTHSESADSAKTRALSSGAIVPTSSHVLEHTEDRASACVERASGSPTDSTTR